MKYRAARTYESCENGFVRRSFNRARHIYRHALLPEQREPGSLLGACQRQDCFAERRAAFQERWDFWKFVGDTYLRAVGTRREQEHLVQADALVSEKIGRVRAGEHLPARTS